MREEVKTRRFPPPWDVEEANASCFIVKDNNGQALAMCISRVTPAGARLPICARATKRDGLQRILRSCWSWCGKIE
jgi:hypothetical protein